MGWLLETIFASMQEFKFINRGFLTGLFCPIYGFCAILVVRSSELSKLFFENPITSLFMSILFSIFLVTALEYITGLLLEKIFNSKCWDYSDNAVNLHGYICLKYSLGWGLLAFILVQVAHPAISRLIMFIPVSMKGYIAVFIVLYFIADTSKSVFGALDLREVILHYSKLSVNKYRSKIFQYKRFFLAFPYLLMLNAGILNRDVRGILNDRIDKIKVELKSRFQ